MESIPNGVTRTAPPPYNIEVTLSGVAMVEDYILITEAGQLSADGKEIDQPGTVQIFTTQYKFEQDNRYATHLFMAEIPPWSPIALASDLKRVVTGGIFCGEQQNGGSGGCDDGLMGVVDIWDLTGEGFGTKLQRNTTFTFDSWVTTAEFSPDGTNIIIGCQDGSISLLSRKNAYGWDCPWKVLKNITNAVPPTIAIPPYMILDLLQGSPQVMQIDWSPDGNRFVVSSPTGNFFKIYST
jgi:WD40 repeat protein